MEGQVTELMMQKPNLSVIMNVYNLEDVIASLIESIVLPNLQEVEYVIVDRASEDRTLSEAIGRIQALGLKAITIQNGFGSAASAVNTGLFRSSGRYVKFLTPRNYSEKFRALCRKAWELKTEHDMVVPVHESFLPETLVLTGQAALEKLVRANMIPEFGSILYLKSFLEKKQLRFTESPQMAGLGLEFTIKAMAQAGSVLLIPMDCRPVSVRKEIYVPNKIEFSPFLRIDAVERAMEDIRAVPAIRPSIIDELMHYYIPQKLMECIEELLTEGRGYTAIVNYIRMHNYSRFFQTRDIKDKTLRKKMMRWKRMPWMYKLDQEVINS